MIQNGFWGFFAPHSYIKVAEVLSTKRGGLSREELISVIGKPSGGDLSKVLNNLVLSGFVRVTGFTAEKRRMLCISCVTIIHLSISGLSGIITDRMIIIGAILKRIPQEKPGKDWCLSRFAGIILPR